MRRRIYRKSVALWNAYVAVLGCAPLSVTSIAAAQEAQVVELNIERQPLIEAMGTLFGYASAYFPELNFRYLPSNLTEEFTLVGPIRGQYSVDEALEALLAPVGWGYVRHGHSAVLLVSPNDPLRCP